MVEVLRSNDPVELSWAQAVLRAAGIEVLLLDEHTSVLEGSIGAIPRRLVVADEDGEPARQRLQRARAALGDR
jgi:hypothetical protein